MAKVLYSLLRALKEKKRNTDKIKQGEHLKLIQFRLVSLKKNRKQNKKNKPAYKIRNTKLAMQRYIYLEGARVSKEP